MNADVFSFQNPFRPIYEDYAVAGWFASAIVALAGIYLTDFPETAFIIFAAICCLFGGLRAVQAAQHRRRLKHMTGSKLAFISRQELRKKVAKHNAGRSEPDIWMGYGFNWTQQDAQLAHTIYRADPNRVTPPADGAMGQPWIHGIGMEREEDIWLPIEHTAGHILLTATTRWGKTRTLDLLISQAVQRGEPCLILDPKSDRGLRDAARNAMVDEGRPDDFLFFHPAFPEASVMIDPLENFQRATELASRIAGLIQSKTGNDPFVSHSMMVLNNLCEGLLMVHEKPTIKLLKRYIDNGPEGLVIRACEAHFDKQVPDWRKAAASYLEKAKGKTSKELALAYVNYYRDSVIRTKPNSALEALMADFEHDKSHQSKMIASLTPLLTQLTSGHVGTLLSPERTPDDPRLVTDFAKIIRNRQTCYIALGSLQDPMVGSAIGSLLVSDLTSLSGDRYAYSPDEELKPVNVFIDEAAELVSDKMIQLLNKSGGSGFRLVIATQSFADFSARMGSADKARQVLANLNHVVAGRIVDGDTQDYVAESMPETYVRHIEYSQATDTRTSNLLDFGYRLNESMKETAVPLVPKQMFGCLPNLESFAKLSGGRIVKTRVPILIGKEAV